MQMGKPLSPAATECSAAGAPLGGLNSYPVLAAMSFPFAVYYGLGTVFPGSSPSGPQHKALFGEKLLDRDPGTWVILDYFPRELDWKCSSQGVNQCPYGMPRFQVAT